MLTTQRLPRFHLGPAARAIPAGAMIPEEDQEQAPELRRPPLAALRNLVVRPAMVWRKSGDERASGNTQASIATLKRTVAAAATLPTCSSLNTAPKQPLQPRAGGSATSDSTAATSGPDDAKRAAQTNEKSGPLEQRAREGSGEGASPGGAAGGEHHDEDEGGAPMAPRHKTDTGHLAPLVWRNIILFIILHSSILIGARMLYLGQVSKWTLVWSLVGIYASGLGVTGGAHRLWSHRAYKAAWPVQVLLMLLQTMAGQNSIYTWCRDHRVHHKFSETNADPHNIKRGFLFAHMGWLCCRKHPEVSEKGKLIDMSDLEANPVVMFQHRHFWWLAALCTVLVPSYIPVLLWSERFWSSFIFSFMLRYLITLHGTWLVNSAAHYFGSRPYDERIEARESPFVILTGLGEGFHNYHHAFPHDYSTSEFGKFFNITTAFIDLCATLGLVSERRSMSRQVIEQRRLRTGDGGGKERVTKEAPDAAASSSGAAGRRRRRASPAAQSQLDGHAGANDRLVDNLIQELPYISGMITMKLTM